MEQSPSPATAKNTAAVDPESLRNVSGKLNLCFSSRYQFGFVVYATKLTNAIPLWLGSETL